MLIGEPAATAYDLRFGLFGIPIRVHPFFWLVGVFLGARGHPSVLIMWVGVLFVSILVHELGHALTMRYFGLRPHVVLYSFGGMAIADSGFSEFGGPSSEFGGPSARIGARERILYTLAGPGAGFMLAALVVIGVLTMGGQFLVNWANFPFFWQVTLAAGGQPLDRDEYQMAYRLVNLLLYVNILWGLVNLLPVYPLDGGQIARELMSQKDPWRGVVQSLWLSVYTAAAIAAWALIVYGEMFIAVMFGLLAYSSYNTLQRGGWR